MDSNKKRIIVVGMGYVGMSMATMLSCKNTVIAVDTDVEKVNKINNSVSPIKDEYIENYLIYKNLDLTATTDGKSFYGEGDFVIIAVPTNYDDVQNKFDCTIVNHVIEEIYGINSKATIIIKSTVPVGYTEEVSRKHKNIKLIFCPEFLRESKALYDSLYPSRIVIGCCEDNKEYAEEFLSIIVDSIEKKDVFTQIVGTSEAESIKLFSNTYLALRVAFFNELDTYAEEKGLNTEQIIKCVCQDPRIGDYYNNPSFGYGGYCLPKDTKQLLSSYDAIPQNMMSAIVESNKTRKEYVVQKILELARRVVGDEYKAPIGVYRLTMKTDSDNFRQSSVIDIINMLIEYSIKIIIYEPLFAQKDNLFNQKIELDLDKFKKESDVIIANRFDNCLKDIEEKVYTRDLFKCD